MTPTQPVPGDVLASLAALVEARFGLRFAGGRSSELATKLAAAFAESGCETWQAYHAHLADAATLDQLVEKLTVGETYFYRHRPYFEMLEREILPEIMARRRGTKQLRLWCAGCATGEEAYSLAIAVKRVLPAVDDWQVSIIATDLNRGFLARAEAGVYSEWSFRETDKAFKSAYFVAEARRYRIKPELRQMVRFGQLNLAENGYPSAARGIASLDLVLCRNVLLYFGPELTGRVVQRLRSALMPGGWLVLGPSDSRPGLLADFEMHAGDGAVVYRRADHQRTEFSPTREPIQPMVVDTLTQATPWEIEKSIDTGKDPAPSEELEWREAWAAARASADCGDLGQAEVHCQQAMTLARLRPEPYYLYGALCQARGDDQASLAAFRKALYVDPTFVPALLAQAAIHRRGGASERARQVLVRAQRLLDGRSADEWVLPEDGLSVGRLRDAVVQALGEAC